MISVFVILITLGTIIGYTTKRVSVLLMFRPSRFIGLGPIGWQGVVQRRSPKFAADIADTIHDIAPVSDIVSRIDHEELARVAAHALDPVLADLTPVLVEQLRPGLWHESPAVAQEALTATIQAEVAGAMAEVADKAMPTLVEALDVRPMVIDLLSGENADRLAALVQSIAAKDLRAMIRFGAVVGFVVGFLEAIAFLTFDRWWLLPLIGAVDGTVNNYLGIQMIFRPLEPRRYFGRFEYQGLFPKRQAEIAADYGRLIAEEVLTPRAIVREIANSPVHDELVVIVSDALDRRLATQLDMLGPMLGFESTAEVRAGLVATTMAAIGSSSDQVIPDLARFPPVEEYLERRLEVAATIETALAGMSSAEFEHILRGIFEEDERTLIGVGAVIGFAIGLVQAAVVVGLGLR